MIDQKTALFRSALVLLAAVLGVLPAAARDELFRSFQSPPDEARPGVYWYFMDGNSTSEGMAEDLRAMHDAGLRKALFLEVNLGMPQGPVPFMSEAWQDQFAAMVREADRIGMQIILGTGPGWAGAGGPWVTPERSMQHLCASSIEIEGPGPCRARLPVPPLRKPVPFAGLSPALAKLREDWHRDVAVLAFPSTSTSRLTEMFDIKALFDVQPYSSWKHVPRFIPAPASWPDGAAMDPERVVDLTARLRPDGSLDWEVPPGKWTVMRFAARNNSVTTRPAPSAGHGFETDRFDSAAFDHHFASFHRKLLDRIGPRRPGRGLTALHLDSWESSSQNWSAVLREEFRRRRGYDPLPFYPAWDGRVVGSRGRTERFLWDLRATARELVIEHHAGAIRRRAHASGLQYTSQFYDMNPAGDLDLGAEADVVCCEFWSGKIDSVYSCVEAAAIAGVTGRPVVRAEAFTAPPGHGFRDNPADLKNQADWAFSIGVNDIIFHTYPHQPLGGDGPKPGMAMGPYGIHWHRNQTFWPMVAPFHDYLARCGQLLRQGASMADVLYLVPEGAPHIFLPPEDAMTDSSLLREKKGHGFGAVSPRQLLARATVEDGRISFPGGGSYRVLVLPLVETMTPELLEGISRLVRSGASVIGLPPAASPSLSGYPACDEAVAKLAADLWGGAAEPVEPSFRPVGKGGIHWGGDLTRPASADKLYPSFESTTAWLRRQGAPGIFQSNGPLRHHARRTPDHDIFFVANRSAGEARVTACFRTDGSAPEWWDPVDGSRRALPEWTREDALVRMPMSFAPRQSGFVVFRRGVPAPPNPAGSNTPVLNTLVTLDAPYQVRFDPAWGGPSRPVTFPSLTGWHQHDDPAIRHYSGEAVYQRAFDAPPVRQGRRVFLDLGVVHKMARVRLNGRDLGIVWTPPCRVEVTSDLRPTGNQLEITVVNTWVNRLVGDQQPGFKDARTLSWENGLLGGRPQPAGKHTFSTVNDYKPGSPLHESGLIGPVRLVSQESP